MRWLLLVVLIMLTGASLADDAFRDDFDDVAAWQARPDWLGYASANPVARSEAGIGKFEIGEPGKGMKWLRLLDDPVDTEMCPWLVIRYRAANLDPVRPDYVVWVKDNARQKEGVRLITGDRITVDDQWHTLVANLPEAGVVSPVSQIALQCMAGEAGGGRLWVDYIAMTDIPPADAEGYQAPQGEGREWLLPLGPAESWGVKPDWLSNYSPRNNRALTTDGLRFWVGDGMGGAKWARELAEPIEGAQWVAMRYRARNTHNFGEYALYIAATGGGSALQEQYAIHQADLAADGQWHVAIGRVTIPTIRTLAIQVQARRDNATLEISSIRFLERKPVIRLADTIDARLGWPAGMGGWRVVDLPPGNLSGEGLARRLGAEGWPLAGPVTVSGVPFTVRPGTDAVVMTPLREPGEVAVPLSGTAREAYLLLAAKFPQNDEPSYGATSGVISHVNRLVARIEYADGETEEQFPFAVGSGRHAISPWVHAYSLALQPKPLRKLSLVDGMKLGAFGLIALTLSDKPGPATAATALKPALALPAEKPVAARAAGITRKGDVLAVDAWSMSMALDLRQGLRVSALRNHSGEGLGLGFTPGPLFRFVLPDGSEVTSEQFTVESAGEAPEGWKLQLRSTGLDPALGVTVWVDVQDPREIGLRATFDLNGHNPAETKFIFPELRDLSFGSPPATWIWCPRRGDVITAEPISLREPYAGAGNPLQVVGTFDPAAGTGLYLMTQDMDAVSRFYHVQKSNSGTRLAVEYFPTHDPALPRTVIGCTQGDWHAHLQRYQEWAATWYQPAAPRKRWFREVFNFRQQFLHFALPTPSGMFDPETKALRIKEVLEADAEAFGGADYLHLFDWGWDPVHGRCGDYLPWDYLGGVDNFRRAVAEVQDAGTPVGLYIEGILVDQESNLGQAHGKDWQMLGPSGEPYAYFAPSYHVCPRVPEWQRYLSDTYARVRSETGASGFYIDEYGFSGPTYWCYNPNHGHPVPVTPVLGERQTLQQVRAKLGPEAAIYTEESPTDVNSQFQDGSFTYNISSASDDWSPSHVNLYRFAFPDFKTIEIICCDQPLGTNVEAVKRCLFNGEAIWIEGIRDKWFAPESRAQIALNHRVMRENRQCFAGDHVQPLVPTLLSGVYANRFSERADVLGKTCWTIYNTNYRTVRGEVIAVDHAPGAQYLDEMTGRPLQPRVVGDKAYLTLNIAPRDVVVVSRGLYVE
ncbi:MAG: hypothetical protein HPY69_19235 [Armatimonadetes bacterium]|nr:hypothetical protein [Armatimonadota bacterium]